MNLYPFRLTALLLFVAICCPLESQAQRKQKAKDSSSAAPTETQEIKEPTERYIEPSGEWEVIHLTPRGWNYYYHINTREWYSNQYSPRNVRVWVMARIKGLTYSERYAQFGNTYSFQRLAQYDCVNRKTRTLVSISLDRDGNTIERKETPHARFIFIAPETTDETILDEVCEEDDYSIHRN